MRLWFIAFVFLLTGPVAAQQPQIQGPAPVQSAPGVNAPANVHLDDRGHPIQNSRARRGIETGTLGGLGEEGRITPEYQSSGPDLDMGLRREGDRRIGAQGPIQKDPPGREWWDPLSGHDNQRPRSTVVGPGSVPTANDLVSGEDVETIDTGDGGKIVFRHGESSSTEVVYGTDGNVDTVIVTDRESDGSRTETAYSPGDDGSTYIRESHYDQDGEVLYTTESIREATPAGQRTRPNSRYQPDDTGGGGDGGGWYNPITGVSQGTGKVLSGNRVRPAGDGGVGVVTGPALNFDFRKLYTDPGVEEAAQGTPRHIEPGGETIVDPPRPPE